MSRWREDWLPTAVGHMLQGAMNRSFQIDGRIQKPQQFCAFLDEVLLPSIESVFSSIVHLNTALLQLLPRGQTLRARRHAVSELSQVFAGQFPLLIE
jgi:hypothetical protein